MWAWLSPVIASVAAASCAPGPIIVLSLTAGTSLSRSRCCSDCCPNPPPSVRQVPRSPRLVHRSSHDRASQALAGVWRGGPPTTLFVLVSRQCATSWASSRRGRLNRVTAAEPPLASLITSLTVHGSACA
jgi:hypothetical protein